MRIYNQAYVVGVVVTFFLRHAFAAAVSFITDLSASAGSEIFTVVV